MFYAVSVLREAKQAPAAVSLYYKRVFVPGQSYEKNYLHSKWYRLKVRLFKPIFSSYFFTERNKNNVQHVNPPRSSGNPAGVPLRARNIQHDTENVRFARADEHFLYFV